MDYRRFYGLRAPRPVGDSTFLVPQMENYTLFAAPFLDLRKKIDKLIEGKQEDIKSKSGKDAKAKGKAKQGGDEKAEGKQKPSDSEITFGIILNVIAVRPEELVIKFGEGNELEVKVQQRNITLKDRITFSRNCTYKYELPDGIDKNSLMAVRTLDDYLIILPGDLVREDLFKKSAEEAKELEKLSDEVVSSIEVTESTDKEETDGKAKIKQKGSKETTKPKKVSIKEEPEMVPSDENSLTPVQVSRMLRPGMDIFMLRKYMSDLESYVTMVRNFVENASYMSQNSATAERCIRAIAKEKTDKYYEDRNIEGQATKRKFTKEPSPESGYTSSEKSISRLPQPDAEDETSTGSSTKSGQLTEEISKVF